MSQLKSTVIRTRIRTLCEFCVSMITERTLRYDGGLTKDAALKELAEILKDVESSGDFTIAFVGEYSSGKTTIINLLTNTSGKTGTSVTTQEARKLRWNNVCVIDTPGLGSGQLQHDEKTEEWLAKADLLVYVLTPDLFGSRAGARFVNMLDKYKREHEMMVVVNMIDKEGNEITVYEEELQNALGHRRLDDYFPTFISAKDKEMSLDARQPPERRELLSCRSRFDMLQDNLNNFVLDRRERASLTTPLARLQVLLRKISFSTEYDKEDSLLNLRIATVEKALRDVKHVYADFREDMNDCVGATAGVIFDALGDPHADITVFCEGQLEVFSRKVEDTVSVLGDRLNGCLLELREENNEIDQSTLAEDVRSRISESDTLKKVFSSFTRSSDSGTTKVAAEWLKAIEEVAKLSGKAIPEEWSGVLNASNVIQAASKLASMVDRNLVLRVGRTVGYKFKPWGAVKLSRRFAQAVPLLDLAGGIWEYEAHRREKNREKEAAEQLRQFKSDLKGMLHQTADKIVQAVYEELVGNVEQALVTSLRLVTEQKRNLAAFAKDQQEICRELESKRTECLVLYDDVYGSPLPPA